MKEVGNAPHVRSPPTFIYIFIRTNCSFENEKLKKNKGKRKTHNVSKSTTCQMHTNYAERKRKIT